MNLISSNNIPFKGYDAAPLRRITVSDFFSKFLLDELKDIGEKENITILSTTWGPQWYQDSEVILKGDKKPKLLMSKSPKIISLHYQERREQDIYPLSISPYYVTGGNCYIGKYPNGENWMLTGDEELINKNRKEIAKEYNIKPENIHFIPNKNYHLDTFIRPIGYPYILVDDEKLVINYINKINSKNKDANKFKSDVIEYEQKRKQKYSSTDEVCKKLESIGFIPIKVPGVWGKSINFMNAIVNMHDDGTISYITGSSKCKNKFISNIEKIFEEELKKKVPNIQNIYFVQGKKDKDNIGYGNKIMQSLEKFKGGLHCMSLEEPDFEKWA